MSRRILTRKGGASAPLAPTMGTVGDEANGSGIYMRFRPPTGGPFNGMQIQWSTSSSMTSPTVMDLFNDAVLRVSDSATVGQTAMVAGVEYQIDTWLVMDGSGLHWPPYDVPIYYQLRMRTSVGGVGAWSSTSAPVTATNP